MAMKVKITMIPKCLRQEEGSGRNKTTTINTNLSSELISPTGLPEHPDYLGLQVLSLQNENKRPMC